MEQNGANHPMNLVLELKKLVEDAPKESKGAAALAALGKAKKTLKTTFHCAGCQYGPLDRHPERCPKCSGFTWEEVQMSE